MKVTPIRTHKITKKDTDLFAVLDKYVASFTNKSTLAVTSKIVSICEGSILSKRRIQKDKLIYEKSDYYIEKQKSKYDVILTIKEGVLAAFAGIDESNGNGFYILWPKDAQKTADSIREYLCKRFDITKAAVIITDSKTTPLRWGTTGIAIAHSGFNALTDYRGKPDVFGRKMMMTQASVRDGLAAAAVVSMGEGSEQTPFAVIGDVPFVKFQARNPTKQELSALRINLEDDLYAPILSKAQWKIPNSKKVKKL